MVSGAIMKHSGAQMTEHRREARRRFAAGAVSKAGIVDFDLEMRVQSAIARVPREAFVAQTAVQRAYQDVTLPTPGGGMGHRPSYLARVLGLLNPQKGDRILEVASGSGYFSALLAELGVCVFALEREGLLAQRTRKLLDSLSYQNVMIRTQPYDKGWKDHGPYEAIVFHKPVKEIPLQIMKQLDPSCGRLVAPIQKAGDIRLTLWLATPEEGVQKFEFEQV
jgi:protein-L-isoaspartate(D-aspartate) O-methyltransferase